MASRARGMTAAVVAAIAAGSLMIALAGCGQPGQETAATGARPSSSPAQTSLGRVSSPRSRPMPTPAASQSVTPVPSSSVDTSIEVYADCTSPSFEPTGIRVTCADAGWVLEDLVWTSWTSTRATATGTLVYNDCTPSCVAGHFHKVPGTQVLLTDPRRAVSGQLVWTRLQEAPWPPGYKTGPLHGAPFGLPTRPI
jgi:hypothetical protein